MPMPFSNNAGQGDMLARLLQQRLQGPLSESPDAMGGDQQPPDQLSQGPDQPSMAQAMPGRFQQLYPWDFQNDPDGTGMLPGQQPQMMPGQQPPGMPGQQQPQQGALLQALMGQMRQGA